MSKAMIRCGIAEIKKIKFKIRSFSQTPYELRVNFCSVVLYSKILMFIRDDICNISSNFSELF